MVPPDAVADAILRRAVDFVKSGEGLQKLDHCPVAIYVTDAEGFITYFNTACIDIAGRFPTVLVDRWCVTWKLYNPDGNYLPHNRCPMAVAIKTKRAIRGVTALAERPDGTRIPFLPFPTPVIGQSGELLGAVNMLIDITGFLSNELSECPALTQHISLREALSTFTIEDIRCLIEEIEIGLGQRPPHTLN